MVVSERFPKTRRIVRRSEYLEVQRRGKPIHTRHFVLLVVSGSGRVGVTVSKKVGNAVVRNRIKRLVREVTRRRRWVSRGHDVVVIAKHRAAELTGFAAVAAELQRASARVEQC